MKTRQADHADLDGLVETLTLAFLEDPVWGWAFPESSALESRWRLLVKSALRYPCTWIAGDFEAVAVWLPPGGVELTMALLEQGLSQVDAEAIPAYLESGNSGNNARYEARGFQPVGRFERSDGGPEITMMWREPT